MLLREKALRESGELWKGSRYFQSPVLYKENGFKKKEDAERLIQELSREQPLVCIVEKVEQKEGK